MRSVPGSAYEKLTQALTNQALACARVTCMILYDKFLPDSSLKKGRGGGCGSVGGNGTDRISRAPILPGLWQSLTG